MTDGNTHNEISSVGVDWATWTSDAGVSLNNAAIFWMDPSQAPKMAPHLASPTGGRPHIVGRGEVVVAQLTLSTGEAAVAVLNAQGATDCPSFVDNFHGGTPGGGHRRLQAGESCSYVLKGRGGHSNDPLPWAEAEDACMRDGAAQGEEWHLASIHSASQQSLLEDAIKTGGESTAWIGLVSTPSHIPPPPSSVPPHSTSCRRADVAARLAAERPSVRGALRGPELRLV
eukprot:COSAG04_NODE_38_length_33641_cov_13.222527_17_plen_229_part_00